MPTFRLTTALGTPLTGDDALHIEGLEAHLADQAAAGIDSLLVGGTMGTMQMLPDATWRALVENCARLGGGRFEILAGAGDTSFARTRERIALLNGQSGGASVVVLTPFFWPLSQEELIDYYRALADESKAPLYLYDLPQLTGVALEVETVATLAEHPNIAGIKCSGPLPEARRLMDRVGDRFRVILAQVHLIDVLLRHGAPEHLDGAFSGAPGWAAAIVKAAEAERWDQAAAWQRKLTGMLELWYHYGTWAAFTAQMNARGIPGRFAPRPVRMLDEERRLEFLESEPVRTLVRESSPQRA